MHKGKPRLLILHGCRLGAWSSNSCGLCYMQTTAEYTKRGAAFSSELDFVLANVLMVCALVLMPARSHTSQH